MLNQKSKGKLWQKVDSDELLQNVVFHQDLHYLLKLKYNVQFSGTEVHNYLKLSTIDLLKYIRQPLVLIVFSCMEKSIGIQRVN